MAKKIPRIATNQETNADEFVIIRHYPRCHSWIILFVAISALFVGIYEANAASLYPFPSSGSFTVGSAVSMNVYVSSNEQAMNAVSGVLSFPQDTLEVVSISKAGSIISLWVQEPSFSNALGTATFEGIVLNPGFTGPAGKIITAVFRVKAAGTALVTFSSGSVLANDGKGTNILTSLGNAQFSLVDAAPAAPTVPKEITPSAGSDAPSAPQISSPTHSDPAKWYSTNDAKFLWPLPSGITGTRLLVGKIPQAVPNITYTPAIDSRDVSDIDLADGIWYFHVRLRNAAGWGTTSHFLFQIDTEGPLRFDMKEVERDDATEPKVTFVFDAVDETSGIDRYEIQVDNESPQTWRDDGNHRYETVALKSGTHILIVRAIDKAGNSLASSAEFIIEALNPPTITDYPRELQSGEPLIVHGSAYSNSTVALWLQKEKDDPKSFTIQSGQDGQFTFAADERLQDGIYKLWAEVVSARGARSLPTEKITIVVARPAIFRVGTWAISFLAVVVPLLALIVALLFIPWYGWHKFWLLRKRIRKEVREAESALHKAFDMLKEDVRDQVKLLEKARTKRQLTKEEEKVIKQLKKDLDDAEKFVRKEIEDIEKEI